MKNSTRLLLVILFLPVLASAQSFRYRKHTVEWEEANPAPIPVDEQFKNEDAVILKEDNTVWVGFFDLNSFFLRLNPQINPYLYPVDWFVNFDSAMTYTKHVRIKLLTDKGAKQYSKFVLPESNDKPGDYYSVRYTKRDSVFRPKGDYECVKYFKARVIKADGSIHDAVVDESTQTEEFEIFTTDRKVHNWIFSIKNAEAGDEIEAMYSYENTNNVEPSRKFFFNGALPKQQYRLAVRYSEKNSLIFTYHNGAEPTDSTMLSKSTPHYTEYVFERKNLAGGIDEAGARPYADLPYITFYQHFHDYGIPDERTGFVSKILPYPWIYTNLYLGDYQMDDLDLYLGKHDKTTLELNSFYSNTQTSTDTSALAKFTILHHLIVDKFDYQNDIKYYEGEDQSLEKLGDQIEEHKLRQRSRLHLYHQLMMRLRADFYKGTLYDKRFFQMSPDRYEPENTGRLVYALPYKTSLVYFYPKTARFGYESNELPFYYEDVNVNLFSQQAPAHERFSDIPKVKSLFIKTPSSDAKDNTRSSMLQVEVKLDEGTSTFNGKLRLAGQFSTMTRGYYLYNDIDTTVNPNYFTHLYDIGNDAKVTAQGNKMSSFNQNFPYKAEFELSYSAKDVKKENDVYVLSVSNWFNNVIDDKFTAVHRHLPYYPDFLSQDQHKYMLKLDKDADLLNAADLTANIDNSFATYTSKVTQVDPKTILVETNYIIKSPKVPASNAADVEAVFNQVRKLNASALRFKLKS